MAEGQTEFEIQVPESARGGVWSNFAAVSHSPYEFTIDFVRLDFANTNAQGKHEGQVVARVNLPPLLVSQLMEALETNWSKYAEKSMPRDLGEPG